jgi:DNA-binding NarL/FixJ family response regulator
VEAFSVTGAHKDADMAIRIIIAEDHTLIREALSNFLRQQEDMEIVGQAADGATAMDLAARLQPDVIIMDISMPPVLSGLEATRWISLTWPQVKVIALSMHADPQYVAGMLQAGARGYLLKDADFDELLAAVRTVAAGQTYVSPGLNLPTSASPTGPE